MMFSQRFQLRIQVTRHARRRMLERNMDEALLLDIIETGAVKYRDDSHLWLFKTVARRDDNFLCAAAVIENVLVIKTVMHHFDPEV